MACPPPDIRTTRAWVIALSLGLHRAELLGLNWPMVDLQWGALRVSQGVQRVAGRLVLDELKYEIISNGCRLDYLLGYFAV